MFNQQSVDIQLVSKQTSPPLLCTDMSIFQYFQDDDSDSIMYNFCVTHTSGT